MQSEFSRSLIAALQKYSANLTARNEIPECGSMLTHDEMENCHTAVMLQCLIFDITPQRFGFEVLWYPTFKELHILGKDIEVALTADLAVQILQKDDQRTLFPPHAFPDGSFIQAVHSLAQETESYPDMLHLLRYQAYLWERLLTILEE